MLQTLIDQSLLTRVSDGRYELHELLRQFAAEQLAGDPQVDAQVRMRHAVYYLDRIAGQVADFVSPHGQTALRTIDQELGNIQAAWDWAVAQGDLALIHKALPNVGAYYLQRSRNQEGYAACQRAVARLAGAPLSDAGQLALALAWQANFAIELAQLGQARILLERSLPLLKTGETQPVCAFVYYLLGRLSHLLADVTQARPWLESSLALYQAQDDTVGAARVLSMLGRLTWLAGDYAESCDWYMQSLAHYRRLADPMGSSQVISDLAMLSAIAGWREQADHLFEEAATLAQSLDDPLEMIKARRTIGMALANVGYNAAAAAQFEACLTLADCCEHAALRVDNLVMLAFTRLMQGQYDQVPALSQEAFELASHANHRRDAGFALMVLGLAELGRGEYARASEILRRCLSVYQVTNVADDQLFSLSGLSYAQRGLGDTKGARHTVMLALHTAVQSRSIRAAGIALAAYVNVLLDEQQIERAVELEALVMNHPFAANSRFYQDLNARPVAHHVERLPPPVVAAARARGQARTRLATLDEVWGELSANAAGIIPA
jgi:tetratricopeptide (TPR) repeat protein